MKSIIKELDRSLFQPLAVLPGEGPLADDLRELGVEDGCFVEARLTTTDDGFLASGAEAEDAHLVVGAVEGGMLQVTLPARSAIVLERQAR